MAAPLITTLSRRCTFCHHHHFKISRTLPNRNRQSSTKSNVQQNVDIDKWVGVVGLEIHAQINTTSKLFSGASAQYGGSTNSHVAFFDAALPGTLPVLNQGCVEAGVLTALALKCKINRVSTFDRKHYFYADLPSGYQITQHRKPLAVGGEVVYVYQCSVTSRVERRSAGLVQIQLEQDSGKSLHDAHEGVSLIDLNRAGVGLMEIVTKPEFRSGDDAASFVRDLRDILTTINTCDGRMAEGSLRVDANISIHKPGQPFGVRTEVKNLNSLKSIRLAVDNEIERQIDIIEDGGVIENETRSFDVEAGETVPMRDKEKILDYRFMPEPNLPPLVLHTNASLESSESSFTSRVVLEEVEARMKKLPEEKRRHLEESYDLSLLVSMRLVREGMSDLFEVLVSKHGCSPSVCAPVLLSHYKLYQEGGRSLREEILSEIIRLYEAGEITGGSIVALMEQVSDMEGFVNVSQVAESMALKTVGGDIIQAAMEEVLGKNPKIVKAYQKGKMNQLNILATKVIKKLDGKANRETVNKMMADRLKE